MRFALLACLITLDSLSAADDPTRVYGKESPPDPRLGAPKTLNGYFPFTPPTSKESWTARKQELRRHLQVALGLWPMPEKTPLDPVITGTTKRDGYTVENVYFSSRPGHLVSGNLYRPTGTGNQKLPAILNPHGHWRDGRFYQATEKEVDAQLKMKAESTKEGAMYPLQARCANLAMMGFVVFHYDMVGYADSKAVPHGDGFRDAEAELRAQNSMGLQTWNSIRAYDFLESLPEVDRNRIGVTGASGGGTQTFVLCALDDRPAAAFPAVMVSTAMQGGCVCENCSYLRIGTGNVELAGMFAPKPLAMSAANDWTKEILTKGFPELRQLYQTLGAEDRVAAKAWPEFPHNYNQPAREFMYTWFSRHLLGKNEVIHEKPFVPIAVKDLAVFNAQHPRPADELDTAKLRGAMTKASDAQMAALVPNSDKTLSQFREVVGGALSAMIGGGVPRETEARLEPKTVMLDDDDTLVVTAIGRKGGSDVVPTAIAFNEKFTDVKVVIWVHPKGKSSILAAGKLIPEVKSLVNDGYTVFAIDVHGVGEMTPKQPFTVDKKFAGYTYGYNRPLLANRVRDILTAVNFVKTLGEAKKIELVGWGNLGSATILAKALAGDAVSKLAANMNQFRFENITTTDDPMMLPGAVKYGDIGAFLALCAPGEVLVFNHKGTASGRLSKAAYAAAKVGDHLIRQADSMTAKEVTDWLKK